MTEELNQLMARVTALLIAEQAGETAEGLSAAEDGTLNVSIGLKLSLVKGRLYANGRMVFRKAFEAECEDSIDLIDLNQEALPLGE